MWIGHRQVADLRERETPGLRIGQLPREREREQLDMQYDMFGSTWVTTYLSGDPS